MFNLNIGIIGVGNVGKRAAYLLKNEGFNVTLFDYNENSLKKVSNELNLSYKKVNVLDMQSCLSLKDIDLAITSLPGSIAFNALKNIVSLGINVVDVSFFPEDPKDIGEIAEKNGVSVLLDAGVAPGLSNMLISYGMNKLGKINGGRIYVGGITQMPDPPFGIIASWNTMDLIDEYRRKARLISNGKVIEMDPLSSEIGKIYVKGVGELEYFPTDGLRSLLYTFNKLDYLAEYTLRWPGHIEFMRGLKKLGLLDHKKIKINDAEIYADEFLSNVIASYKSNLNDIVVLVVETLNKDKGIRFTQITTPENDFTAMSRVTGSFLSYAGIEFIKGKIKKKAGLLYPEYLGELDTGEDIINMMKKDGMPIIEEIIK
ncbi:saccharopine dehydrogenase C-terminal domain-containing protein [Caldisphaera lagunensis]|uniref:saccharopine dehydrogenase family protein n=1 Tax=Caldisphaera lagunensis TaxID=200415 RepID=UPI003CCB7C78